MSDVNIKQEVKEKEMIRYANIIDQSVVDGPGVRVVAFLQGCTIGCPGCHNVDLQPLGGGINSTEGDFADLLLGKLTPIHQGITFSGGEPTLQADALQKVITIIREKMPRLDIWVFSGYPFEKIKDLPMFNLVDVLVDSPFVLEKRNLDLPFRGSENQRIIDVQRSLAERRILELTTHD